MLVRRQVLRARQLADQLIGLVDQDGKILRADPVRLATVQQLDEGHLLIGATAYQAGMGGCVHGGFLRG
jgi:hypothetical protein